MDTMSDALQLALAGVVTIVASGGFATIVVRYMERRKVVAETNLTDAQATDILVQAGERAVGILEAQLERALRRIENLEAESHRKDALIRDLRSELIDLRAHVLRLESDG